MNNISIIIGTTITAKIMNIFRKQCTKNFKKLTNFGTN